MRSNRISFNLWKELWKKQIWVFAVSCLAYFLIYPVFGMLLLEQFTRLGENEKNFVQVMQRLFYESMCGGTKAYESSGWLSLILCVSFALGILGGIWGLSYLHDKRKIDFYHSLPIRREKLLLVQTGVAVFDYFIAAVPSMLLLMCVSVFRGAFTLKAFAAGVASLLVGFVFFFLAYVWTVLAMLLTGRVLVGICGTAVFFLYMPVLSLVLQWYGEYYFDTFCMNVAGGNMLPVQYVNPMIWVYMVSDNLWEAGGWLVLAAGVAVLVFLLDIVVYRKRSSEAAGNSMAFQKPAAVIRVFLVVLLTLADTIFFASIGGQREDAWMLFGYVFGLLLSYAIVQMIYYLDIRKVFSEKSSILVSAIAAFVVIAVFRFDLIGYDTYLPGRGELAAISIDASPYTVCENVNFPTGEHLERTKFACDDSVYDTVRQLAETSFQEKKQQDRLVGFYVLYELNHGKKIYRHYRCSKAEIQAALEKLYDNAQWVDSAYGILRVDNAHIGSMRLSSNSDSTLFSEEDKKRYELADAVRKDLKKIHTAKIRKEKPIGILSYSMDLTSLGYQSNRYVNPFREEKEDYSYEWEESVYIYPSFVHTCDFLRKMGYALEGGTLDSSQIGQITVWEFGEEGSSEKVVYTDKKEIEQITPKLVPQRYVTVWMDTEDSKAADVLLQKEGSTEWVECGILKEKE